MITNRLAVVCKELYDSRCTAANLVKIFQSVLEDVENMEFVSAPVSYIASYIHTFFTIQNMSLRSCLLQIICELEAASPTSIIEENRFDLLVAQSLDARYPDPQPKIDDEKMSALKLIATILRFRSYLPQSILRGLVSLHSNTKHNFHDYIVILLLKAAFWCPENVREIPEIGEIIINQLCRKGSPEIAHLIIHALEKDCEFATQKNFISRIIQPLTKLQNDAKEDLSNCVSALSTILLSWPGVIHYGLHRGLLRDLLRCLPFRTGEVISILKKLLRLNTNNCVLDGYTGLVMFGLKELGLEKQLHAAAKVNEQVALFLNQLLPYMDTTASAKDIINTRKVTISSEETSGASLPITRAYTVQKLGLGDALTSITSIDEFELKGENDASWNWQQIERIIKIVPPKNRKDIQKPNARALCLKLLQFFGNMGMKKDAIRPEKAECLFALLDLLLDNEANSDILREAAQFRSALESTVLNLLANREIIWEMFKCVLLMCNTNIGSDVLEKWNLILPVLAVGRKCRSKETAVQMLNEFTHRNTAGITSKFLLQFLENDSDEIFTVTLDRIRVMTNTVDSFYTSIYRDVILLYVVNHRDGDISEFRRNTIVNVICEMMMRDEMCLRLTGMDPNIHAFLKTHGRMVYAMLFCLQDTYSICDVDEEIEWWMKVGNQKYVELFDTAFAGGRDPTIVGSPAPFPSHLFGQLAQTEEGRKKVFNVIPDILKSMQKSYKSMRAGIFAIAHFASEKATHPILEEMSCLQVILSAWNEPSYVLKGTIISALSLVANSRHFASVLEENHWKSFQFGNHRIVLPNDIMNPDEGDAVCRPRAKLEDLSGMENETLLIRQLASPLDSKNAKAQLMKMYQESRDQLKHRDLAKYAHEYISRFSVPSDYRTFIMKIFCKVPIISPQTDPVDIRVSADTCAKIFEILVHSQNEKFLDIPFTKVKIPRLKKHELETRACPRVPEVYLSPEDFKALTKMTFEAFYALEEDQIQEIRDDLL